MLQSFRTPFLTTLCILILLYTFSKLFGPIPFSVNSIVTNKQDLFTVSGEGEATAIPDTATFSVGVTKSAITVAAAQQQANDVVNKLIDELKNLGIKEEDIKTTNFSINPDYDFTGGRQRITGYTVTQNIDVEVKPIEKANDAIDKATTAGANVVGNVTFVLDDKTKAELEKEARQDAINKAKEKAGDIARTAGIKLGRLINVSESLGYQPPILYDRSLETIPGGTGGTPQEKVDLQPGENVIRITVTLSYETL